MDEESIERQVVLAKDLLDRGSSLVITSHQHNALTAFCRQQWTISNSKLIERADLQLVKGNNNKYAYG